MEMVMVVGGSFLGRPLAMAVIMSVRACCGGVDVMASRRQQDWSPIIVGETHLHRSPDAWLLDSRYEFSRKFELPELTVALGQSRPYDHPFDSLERWSISRGASHHLTDKLLGGPSA
jgi:hypothetical protein